MLSCPACGADANADDPRCRCGASLIFLQQLDGLADVWFNRALKARAQGSVGQALEWMAATCAARPTDAEALRALAKLWAQLGRWNEAADPLARAAALEPDHPEIASLRDALSEREA